MGSVSPAQRGRVGGREPHIVRVETVVSTTPPSRTTQTRDGSSHGELVEAVVAAEHQRGAAPRGEDVSHHGRHPGVGNADRLGRRLRGVGERAEEVEDGRHAELAPGGRGVAQGRVEERREAEADAGLPHAVGDERPARRSTTTPSSSSRSAEPQAEEAARLPCLTTRAPVPATTIAAMVEMLTVCARSPPVPQVSTAGASTWIRLRMVEHRA